MQITLLEHNPKLQWTEYHILKHTLTGVMGTAIIPTACNTGRIDIKND